MGMRFSVSLSIPRTIRHSKSGYGCSAKRIFAPPGMRDLILRRSLRAAWSRFLGSARSCFRRRSDIVTIARGSEKAPPDSGRAPITDYAALARALAELAAPAPNHARVYRGQNRDYGQMLPSGLRGIPLRSEQIFRAYTTLLASDEESPDAENFLLWTRVIAQHYGPGSTLLDVTYSLDVALWFALHSLRSIQSRHVFGPPGPLNPRTDTVGNAELMTYEPVDTGVLCVFDVPIAEIKDAFRHGVLLDVTAAPAVFASSPRVRAQHACLVHASTEAPGPDLAQLYACPPISVGRPMSGCDLLAEPSSKLFPGPEEDSWYARLAGIPWIRRLEGASGSLEVKPPIPVNLYVEAHRRPEELLGRLIVTPPVDVQQEAMQIDWCVNPPNGILQRHPLTHSTCVVLEAPVMFSTPTVASGAWNERLLATDLPEHVTTFDTRGSEASSADMTNLFIEMSPLEHTGWDMVERGKPLDAIRALWLVREGNAIVLSYFFQEWPKPGALTGVGCIEFEADDTGLRLRRAVDPPPDRRGPDVPEVIRKRLYTALWIARCCSPVPHLAPFPNLTLGRGDDEPVAIVPWFAGAEARLIEAITPGGARCVVPRMVGTDTEFHGPVRPDGRAIVMLSGGVFGDVEPARIPEPVEHEETGPE